VYVKLVVSPNPITHDSGLQTTSPLFQKSAFSVLRRYSDFLWLYETLSNNNPGVVVPPVPEKNPFGRFDDQFVRQRRFALEKCIHKIANHPVLGKDSDLKLFLESDTFALDVRPVPNFIHFCLMFPPD
jgi:sorting nexin-1/2